jgi:hypothetical protein
MLSNSAPQPESRLPMSASFWTFYTDSSMGEQANVSIQPSKFPSLKLSLNVPANAGKEINKAHSTTIVFISFTSM